jgi:4-amino-4-deoxy-L-arabinose transferase-like glycosyltransferase
MLLVLFVLLWTAFQVISRGSTDLNPDLVEVYAWSRHLSAGYYKHPPLGGLLAALWFAVFPPADWAFDLLAMVNAAVGLFAVHRIARLYMPADKALLVLILLLLTPFYQFHGQRFASNQTLLSTWPIATYCFLRAFHNRSLGWSIAAGASAGAAMLGKYYSVYLVAAFALGALVHPMRWAYLRSLSPWVSTVTGFVVLAPHLYWLTTAEITPFAYAYAVHAASSHWEVLWSVVSYLVGGVAYMALLLAAYAAIVRPDLRLFAQTLRPPDPDRHMLIVLLAGQLLWPALTAPLLGVRLTPLWTMQSWFLLPIVLLAPAAVVIPRSRAVALAGVVLAFTALSLIAAPAVAWIRHVNGSQHGEAFYRSVSEEVTKLWHSQFGRPLRIVAGTWAEAVTFYSPDHPDSVQFDLRTTPWISPDRLKREGYVMLCDEAFCVPEINRRAAASPLAVRRELELSRSYLGRLGPMARWTILIVPPEDPTKGPPQ